LIQTAAIVKDWMAAKDFRLIEHPHYLSDLAPAGFFLFLTIKRQLPGKTLTQETFKSVCEGAILTTTEEDFAIAFRRWYEHCEKCVNIGSKCAEKP
jgi:hypothetical protein